MKADQQNRIVLDPFDHKKSVRQFFKLHNIKQQKPGLTFLGEILAHFAQIPYENISKIVKLHKNYEAADRIRLPDEVLHDHEAYHLGGTCFSLTFTLQSLLSESGFLCYPFIAHMNNRPNAHCALLVLLEGKKYLADPGYLLNQPMELHKDRRRIYRTEHTGIELVYKGDEDMFHLFTFNHNNIKWRYRFQDKALSMEKFLGHWWASFYWPGMRGICLTQVKQDGMIYVHNDFVQVQNLQGMQKGHVQDIHRLVNESFRISPEWVERALAAIPDIISRGQEKGYYRNIE